MTFEALFATRDQARDNFLSRLFGMFSEEVVRTGQYVTIRIETSPALAGGIGIWIAKKGPDGHRSAFSPHTGGIADARGVVDYYYRARSIAWLAFQAHYRGAATHPAAVSNAVQARWVP